ncbi:YpmS family protein [Gracilibacillus oryzae]|uniref:YpmS family protein n=1 Tax=Gracilibacillus oryzae TaxID=1672701 RepID=UPI001D1910E3|nr:YpmS family protein [Gracilibacillus oryzae]
MKESRQKNWKRLFVILMTVNITILLAIVMFIMWPVPGEEFPDKQYIEEEAGAEFTIQSSKNNLTQLVNEYIDKLLKDKDDKYAISLDQEVHLMGTIEAFEAEVPVNITFDPIVQENGDVILQSTEMSLGLLRLPKDKILKYVNDKINTPDWVVINPKEESIYIALTQMDIGNFKVRVQQFDLENDQLSFRIKIPNETLGLE